MDSDRVDELKGMDWLVEARNQIQNLMLELHERWKSLDVENRQFAAGAAFSLWRAVFLLAMKEETLMKERLVGPPEKPGRVDRSARAFIGRVVKTNTVTFTDEMNAAHFSAGYYVNNAAYRVSEMKSVPMSALGSSVRTLRTSWNDSFKRLRRFVMAGERE